MQYIFDYYEVTEPNGSTNTRPTVVILDDIPNRDKLEADISYLVHVNYLEEIIDALQGLLNSVNIEPYEWGHEIYSIICDGNYCRCHDNFSSTPEKLADAELILSTDEVLQLMTDWRAFVIQWRIEIVGQDPNLFT